MFNLSSIISVILSVCLVTCVCIYVLCIVEGYINIRTPTYIYNPLYNKLLYILRRVQISSEGSKETANLVIHM